VPADHLRCAFGCNGDVGTSRPEEQLEGETTRSDAHSKEALHGLGGVIWVYGVGEDGVMAFTDFGIENLIDLIKMRKDRTLLNHRDGDK
jgi:hypothetical protein